MVTSINPQRSSPLLQMMPAVGGKEQEEFLTGSLVQQKQINTKSTSDVDGHQVLATRGTTLRVHFMPPHSMSQTKCISYSVMHSKIKKLPSPIMLLCLLEAALRGRQKKASGHKLPWNCTALLTTAASSKHDSWKWTGTVCSRHRWEVNKSDGALHCGHVAPAAVMTPSLR